MAFMKYATVQVEDNSIEADDWNALRHQSNTEDDDGLQKHAKSVDFSEFHPDDYLFSHATIIASVDTKEAKSVKTGQQIEHNGRTIKRPYNDYRITPETQQYINSNNDAWSRETLLNTYDTFIGAENYCFEGSAPVKMSDGTTKPIEEVEEGDKVITHKGHVKPVIHKHERDYQGNVVDIYTDEPDDPVTATPNHPFYRINRENDLDDLFEVPSEKLGVGDRVGSPRDVHEPEIDFLDKSEAKIVGYYRSEGVRLDREESEVEFTFASDEGHCVQDVIDAARIIDPDVGISIYERTESRRLSYGVSLHSTVIAHLVSNHIQDGQQHETASELFTNSSDAEEDASVHVEEDDWDIKTITDKVTRPFDGTVYNLEVADDHSYIVDDMAVSNCEHVQIPELSKGKVIDSVPRDVGDSVYIDILVATNRKHKSLIQDIKDGKVNKLSMGCSISYSLCTKCGNVAADETDLCDCIRHMQGSTFTDEDGDEQVVAELCFPGDTNIATQDGMRPISDVESGDRVLTHEGRFKAVTETYERSYDGYMVDLDVKGMTETLSSTPNHPYYALTVDGDQSVQDAVQDRDLAFKEASDLTSGDFVAVPGTGDGALGPRLRRIDGLIDDWHIYKNYVLLPVESVSRSSYQGKVYNIGVEDDHSYLAEGVAVHNCGHPSDPDSVKFIEASWVADPAFEGAVLRNTLHEDDVREYDEETTQGLAHQIEQAHQISLGRDRSSSSMDSFLKSAHYDSDYDEDMTLKTQGDGNPITQNQIDESDRMSILMDEIERLKQTIDKQAQWGDDEEEEDDGGGEDDSVLDKAIEEVKEDVTDRALDELEDDMSDDADLPRWDAPPDEEGLNDSIIQAYHQFHDRYASQFHDRSKMARVFEVLYRARSKGWESVRRASHIDNRDIVASMYLKDRDYRGQSLPMYMYHCLNKVGGTSNYQNVDAFINACELAIDHRLTRDEKKLLIQRAHVLK